MKLTDLEGQLTNLNLQNLADHINAIGFNNIKASLTGIGIFTLDKKLNTFLTNDFIKGGYDNLKDQITKLGLNNVKDSLAKLKLNDINFMLTNIKKSLGIQ